MNIPRCQRGIIQACILLRQYSLSAFRLLCRLTVKQCLTYKHSIRKTVGSVAVFFIKTELTDQRDGVAVLGKVLTPGRSKFQTDGAAGSRIGNDAGMVFPFYIRVNVKLIDPVYLYRFSKVLLWCRNHMIYFRIDHVAAELGQINVDAVWLGCRLPLGQSAL